MSFVITKYISKEFIMISTKKSKENMSTTAQADHFLKKFIYFIVENNSLLKILKNLNKICNT